MYIGYVDAGPHNIGERSAAIAQRPVDTLENLAGLCRSISWSDDVSALIHGGGTRKINRVAQPYRAGITNSVFPLGPRKYVEP